MHEVSWVKLDIDAEAFLNFHHTNILNCIHAMRSEFELTMGNEFVGKFLNILTHHLNEGLEIVKQKIYPLLCDLNEDDIPESFYEICSQFMEMFKAYTEIKDIIYIRISDESYFEGKIVKAEAGCFFVDINGFYIEYLLYDRHLKIFRNDNVKFPQLIPPVLKALDTIFNNKGQ